MIVVVLQVTDAHARRNSFQAGTSVWECVEPSCLCSTAERWSFIKSWKDFELFTWFPLRQNAIQVVLLFKFHRTKKMKMFCSSLRCQATAISHYELRSCPLSYLEFSATTNVEVGVDSIDLSHHAVVAKHDKWKLTRQLVLIKISCAVSNFHSLNNAEKLIQMSIINKWLTHKKKLKIGRLKAFAMWNMRGIQHKKQFFRIWQQRGARGKWKFIIYLRR